MNYGGGGGGRGGGGGGRQNDKNRCKNPSKHLLMRQLTNYGSGGGRWRRWRRRRRRKCLSVAKSEHGVGRLFLTLSEAEIKCC